jgi:hypothetical protein
MLFSPCKTRDSGINKRFGSICIKAMGWTAKQHENAIDRHSSIFAAAKFAQYCCPILPSVSPAASCRLTDKNK